MTAAAVVFDLGNVLIRWDPHPAVAAGVGAAEATRFLAEFDFHAYNHLLDQGQRIADAEAALGEQAPEWLPYVVAYRANFGLSLSELTVNVRLLRDLEASGVPLFALTNWSDELFPQALDRFDFLGLFDDIVVSGAERVAKPDPAIFEVLRRRVGRPLDECVFVDDSPVNVAAGAESGLDAIRYDGQVDLRAELRTRGFTV